MPPRTLLAARAMLTHILLTINQNPQVPFCSRIFRYLIPHSVHMSRVVASQVQNPAFISLAELLMVGDCPSHWLVKSLQQGFSTFKGANNYSQFSIVGKFSILSSPVSSLWTGWRKLVLRWSLEEPLPEHKGSPLEEKSYNSLFMKPQFWVFPDQKRQSKTNC